jgi:hypothetical protein
MFGHTFMRIDPPNVETGSKWLSWALNFGATIRPDDNSFLYAWNGLFGGYPGHFSVQPYYEKLKEYSQLENRDLWEYDLNLTKAETRTLVLHLWDLRHVRFDYYFFDENCSYRLLELLEFARPGVQLTTHFPMTAIPIDTVKAVLDAGLVRQVHYVPAVITRIADGIGRLDSETRALAYRIAVGEVAVDAAERLALPEAEQLDLLRTAYKFLRLKQINKGTVAAARLRSMAILKAINALPPLSEDEPAPPERPDRGHHSRMLALTTGQVDEGDFGELKVRLSYHDLNDNPLGFLRGASLNLGEFHARRAEGGSLQLQRFSAVEIQSHSVLNRYFRPITWRVQTGLERMGLGEDSFLAPQVNGGAGVTFEPLDGLLLYGLVAAQAEYNEHFEERLLFGMGPLVGAMAYLPLGTFRVEALGTGFADGQSRFRIDLVQQIDLSLQHALRLQARRQSYAQAQWNEVSLEWRHTF